MKKLLIGLFVLGSFSSFASVCSIESHQVGLRLNYITVQPIYQLIDFSVTSEEECLRNAEDVHQKLLTDKTYKNTTIKFWKKNIDVYDPTKPKADMKKTLSK